MEPNGGPFFPAFPFTPYPIQLKFMQNLYQTLEDGKVGLFESPTGTGKTLSIICGALQWLEDYRKAMDALEAAEQQLSVTKSTGENDMPAWMLQQRQQLQQQEQQRKAQDRVALHEQQAQKRKAAAVTQFGGTTAGKPGSKQDAQDDEFLLDQRPAISSSDDDSDEDQAGDRDQMPAERKVPQIIFCSRTHSQLSQFVGELYRTSFADWVELVALGSRKNLCVNEEVQRLKQLQLMNERCMELQKQKSSKAAATGVGAQPVRRKHVSKGGCPYLRTTQAASNSFQQALLAAPLDLEELARLGKQQKVCPYYGSRRAVPSADVLLVPYSAVLQPDTRRSLGIELQGSVVIFDEAHNLLDAINSAHSATVTAEQLGSSVAQLSAYFDRYKSRLNPGNAAQLQLLSRLAAAFLDCLKQLGSSSSAAAAAAAAGGGSQVMTCSRFMIELSIDHINLFPLLSWIRDSKVMFKVSGLAAAAAAAAGAVQLHPPAAATGADSEPRDSLPSLHAFVGFLQALTNTNTDGRVIIERQQPASTAPPAAAASSSRPRGQLRFVLLNAAGHFSTILRSARSVVLASGTLSPVDALRAQLFPAVPDAGVQHFECGHVIERSNLVALAVAKGPSGALLDFRHESRGCAGTMDEAGRLLVNLCSVVPGGLVAFVPSFAYCEQLLQRWQATGLLQQLAAKKRFFREPRTSAEVEGALQQYSSCIAQGEGALMLSVVGGKLSEGINFGDGLGRCVVILGMPYPNPSDPELQERMRYLDDASKAGGGGISGRQYYDNLCMNAVNQCVGRVIRHSGDYAAIVLADVRYAQARSAGRCAVQKLPRWIQASWVGGDGEFGAAYGRLKGFFRQWQEVEQQQQQQDVHGVVDGEGQD